ncbi:AAA family ATPase [Qipengyuania sp. CAU 1752]
MGSENNLDRIDESNMPHGRAQVAVVASARHLDALRVQGAAGWLGDADLHAVEADEDFEPELLRSCDIAVLELDPEVPSSMDRIAKVKKYDPDLPIVAAVEHADISIVRTLVRGGVADVVTLPLRADELLQTIVAVVEVRAQQVSGNVRQAPVIAVTRALAGCGSTTVATHLAAMLADEDAEQPNVCLIDLDTQFGRAAEVLDLSPRRDLGDLLTAGKRLDAAFFRSITVNHHSGIALVAAPQDITPLEAIEVERLDAILRTARREFDFVVVDTPANLTNWSLSLLSGADSVLMVVEPSVSALRQAKRRLDLFRNVGLDARKVSIVLNQVKRRVFGAISQADVEEALHREVAAILRADPSVVPNAQEQGKLAYELRQKSTFWADIASLSEHVLAQCDRELPS